VPGAVAHLEQPPPRCAAAAGEPVAIALAREGDAQLLEPGDRARRLVGEDARQRRVGGVVRGRDDVGRVLLGRVVVAHGGLDPALCLGGVAGRLGALGDVQDAGARAARRPGRREPRSARTDHEHIRRPAKVWHGAKSTWIV
jgi:hypothetical protein